VWGELRLENGREDGRRRVLRWWYIYRTEHKRVLEG